jgi:hypothetical protein
MGLVRIAKHMCNLCSRKRTSQNQFDGSRPTNFVYEIGERQASSADTSLQGPDAGVELRGRVGNGKGPVWKLCLQQLHKPVDNISLP